MRTSPATRSTRLKTHFQFAALLLAICTLSCGRAPRSLSEQNDARSGAAQKAFEPDETSARPAYERAQIAVGPLTFDALMAGPTSGELVLLLHGFPQTSYEWRHVIGRLGDAGFRAVAFDQRGYSAGARPLGVENYAVRALVLDALGVAQALGAERFHVVGHDWGAVVGWALAGAVKDRVLSLTAVSTAHPTAIAHARADSTSCQSRASATFSQRKAEGAAQVLLADAVAGLRREFGDLPSDAIDAYVSVLGTQEALDAALNWYRANIDTAEPGPQVGAVAVRTLYVLGDRDPTNCVDTEREHATLVAGPYRFEIFPGVDHWLPERAPEALVTLLLTHLGASSSAKDK